PLRELFHVGERVGGGLIDRSLGQAVPQATANQRDVAPRRVYPTVDTSLQTWEPEADVPLGAPHPAGDSGRLATRALVVLGEGLAAGMGDFTLHGEAQFHSFPNQLARQMRIPFAQPFIEAPGLGDVPGFPRLPVCIPGSFQTTVLRPFP